MRACLQKRWHLSEHMRSAACPGLWPGLPPGLPPGGDAVACYGEAAPRVRTHIFHKQKSKKQISLYKMN